MDGSMETEETKLFFIYKSVSVFGLVEKHKALAEGAVQLIF